MNPIEENEDDELERDEEGRRSVQDTPMKR